MELPQVFRKKMKNLLGEEYEAFLESYDREREQGLRLNLLKTDRERFREETEFSLKPIPWAEEGYYYGAKDRPGRHPYHEVKMRPGCHGGFSAGSEAGRSGARSARVPPGRCRYCIENLGKAFF